MTEQKRRLAEVCLDSVHKFHTFLLSFLLVGAVTNAQVHNEYKDLFEVQPFLRQGTPPGFRATDLVLPKLEFTSAAKNAIQLAQPPSTVNVLTYLNYCDVLNIDTVCFDVRINRAVF